MGKYKVAYGELLRRLQEGFYKPDSQLPGEWALAEELSVHRHTLRRALQMLERDGLIRRQRGVGTVVLRKAPVSDAHKVAVIYRYVGEDSVAMRVVLERFTHLYPWIDVKPLPVPPDPSMAPPVPEMMGGGDPTVLRAHYIADYAKRGALLALDDFPDVLDVAAPLDGRLIYRTADNRGRMKIHALPVAFGVWAMLADRGLLRRLELDLSEEAMSWEEFAALCTEILRRGRDAGVVPFSFTILDPRQTITRFMPLFYSMNGGQPLIDEATCEPRLRDPGNIELLEHLRARVLDGTCKVGGAGVEALDGTKVFLLSSFYQSIQALLVRRPDTDLAVLPVPVCRKADRPRTVVRGAFAGILRHTIHTDQQRQAAWGLVKFLAGAEAQKIAWREARLLPARSDLAHLVAEEPLLQRAFEYGTQYGLPTFDVPKNDDVHRIILRVMMRALTGECRPADAVAEGDELLRTYVLPYAERQRAAEREPAFAI